MLDGSDAPKNTHVSGRRGAGLALFGLVLFRPMRDETFAARGGIEG